MVDAVGNGDRQDDDTGDQQNAHGGDEELESGHGSVHFAYMDDAGATQERITVTGPEAGERLDRVLAARLATLSRSRLKKLIETGQVSLEGATINDPSMRVKAASASSSICRCRSTTGPSRRRWR